MASLKAIILIGGPSKGTRFRPLSLAVPKPLFPIGGVPLLYHHVAACAALAPLLKEVILVGFFEPTLLETFIAETSAALSIPIRYDDDNDDDDDDASEESATDHRIQSSNQSRSSE